MKDIKRRATRLVSGMTGLSYEDRLKKCNLFSLSRRRLRGDMIQVFKIIKGIDKIDIKDLGWELNDKTDKRPQFKIS